MTKSSCEWILLRGLGRQARHWLDFPQALQEALPIDHVRCLDLPGMGSRREESAPASIPATVELLHTHLESLPPHPTRVLLGISFGAMVGVEWLQKHPESFVGGVSINISLRKYSLPWQRLQFGALATLLRAGVVRDLAQREKQLLELVSHRKDNAEALASWVKIEKEQPTVRLNVLRQLGAAMSYTGPATDIRHPWLVVASRQDKLADHRCSERFAASCQLPLVMHPEAGHDLPCDDPAWLLNELCTWRKNLSLQKI